ncbi:MAG TPA: hypothetical protein VFX65_09585 [Candidatus Limnocylindrales bacterium]|nr:hypothetical protein [Candidatus Limnocylindrales bacterium]
MKTRYLSDRTGARASRVAASSLLALSALGAGVGSAFAAPGGGGSIWTNGDPCTTPAAQNDNLYAPGDTVYVRGANFAASSGFDWDISGQPGGASGDPGLSVVSGASTTDADGAFCVAAYVVAADDWGVYSVDVTQGRTSKNDNYRVEGDGTTGDDPVDEPGDETTEDPAEETAEDPADETAEDPADETIEDPADEPGDETLEDPTDETTEEPTDETIEDPADEIADDPADLPADEPSVEEPSVDEPSVDEPSVEEPTVDDPTPAVDDESATDETTDPVDPPTVKPPFQAVLGEVSVDAGIELPATDTVSDVVTGAPSLLLIVGLAGLAGAAVLFAPSRRREPDATE